MQNDCGAAVPVFAPCHVNVDSGFGYRVLLIRVPGLLLTYAMRRAAANYKMFALLHFPHITQVMSCRPLGSP